MAQGACRNPQKRPTANFGLQRGVFVCAKMWLWLLYIILKGENMKDFIKRLTSRKFLLTVAAAVNFYANKQYTEMALVVLAYLGVEGGSDIVATYAQNKYVAPTKQLLASDLGIDDDDDRTITPGLH